MTILLGVLFASFETPPPTPPPGPASAVDQIKPSDSPPSIRGRLRNYGYLDGKYPVSAYMYLGRPSMQYPHT